LSGDAVVLKGKKTRVFVKALVISTVILSALLIGVFLLNTRFFGIGGVAGSVNIFGAVPERVNFLILGVDEGKTRTDTIIAGSFLPKNGVLRVVSVPRDTYVVMPNDRLTVVKSYNPYVSDDGVMKLTEVKHHAGAENGVQYAVAQVQELLGVTFDFYMEIDIEGFRGVVDAVGGVEFDVPARMTHDDPYINLYPGVQLLDGKAAEGLVRYRGYANGDKGRVETQQKFLKALIKRMFEDGNALKSVPAMASAFLQYVDTDFPLADVPKYAGYIKDFTPNNIESYVLPSSPYKFRGKSFEKLDEAATAEIIDAIFYQKDASDGAPESSLGKTIAVLNGGYVSGLAAKTRDALGADGYDVAAIGDYDGVKEPHTRIIVKKRGQGEDLTRYFNNASIEVDLGFSDECDIVIILGTDAS
jgi:LCP family protein required for cell wall assembly